MPTNITGSMIVDKDGNKQSVLNFSNARRKTYAQWQEMTDEQKKGAVIVKDYPTTNLIPSDIIGYGNATVEDALDGTQSSIAPVESSLTASQAYAIGEQFMYQNVLYTATAAITAGGTITINGNCTASDSVTEQIDALINSVTVTPINPNSLIENSITKVGNLVAGNVRFGVTASANTTTNIATIDKKPTDTIYCEAFKTGDYTRGSAYINTDGRITIRFSTALSGTGVAFTFAYKTND